MNLISALVLVIAAGAITENTNDTGKVGDKPVDYKTAYKRAQEGDKPLLVLVTAKWCPPCRTMKSTTIPELMKKKAFKGFHYATVDCDEERELALKLVGNRTLPQLIVFEKKGEDWNRRYLTGLKTVAEVESFVGKSLQIRTADAKPDKVEK